MSKYVSALVLAGLAASAALGFALLGCERAKGLQGIAITPSDFTMTKSNSTYILSVNVDTNATLSSTPNYPLKWSVTDPSLGSIVRSSGPNAVYARTMADGDNIIIVRDQMDNEGYATVHQM